MMNKKIEKKAKHPFREFFKSDFFKKSAKRTFLTFVLLWIEIQTIFYFVDNSKGLSRVVYGLENIIHKLIFDATVFVPESGFFSIMSNTEWAFLISVALIFLVLVKNKFNPKEDMYKNQKLINGYALIINIALMSVFIFLTRHLTNLTANPELSILLSAGFWSVFLMYLVSFLFVFYPIKLVSYYKNEVSFTFLISTSLYFLIKDVYKPLLEDIWIKYIAPIQGKIIYYFIRLFDSTMAYQLKSNHVALNSQNGLIKIIFVCSGFEGITLFLLVFSILAIYDWKLINKGKLFFLYIAGALLMFFANIIRLILIIGWMLYVPQKLFFDAFHMNVGWITYAVVLGLFEYFTYNWLRR